MKLNKKEKMKLARLRRNRLGKSPKQILNEKIYRLITFIIIALGVFATTNILL